MTKLTEVEYIGQVYSSRLETAGVTSVEKLLAMGAKKKGRSVIAQASGLSEKVILDWVSRADLSRIRGVGGQYVDLLQQAGVDTVAKLAGQNADTLCQKMNMINDEKKLVRVVPVLSVTEEWIKKARGLLNTIHY